MKEFKLIAVLGLNKNVIREAKEEGGDPTLTTIYAP